MISVREEDFERELKVITVGNGCVGKTSMIRQFCKGQHPQEYKKTIGVDFLEKTQYVKGLQENVKLMIWDTAGQEAFESITRSYYRGAKAAILCFSTTDRASFEAIKDWKHKIEDECGTIPMVLVQNKVDLIDRAAVEMREAEALAEKLGLRFYRISVKENLYVTEVFEYLAELYLQGDTQCLQTPRIVISGRTSTPNIIGREKIQSTTLSKLDMKAVENINFDFDTNKEDEYLRKKRKRMFETCSIL